ncbi:unnamed protein product [Candidula unifasciata]|uniref:DUF3456 domain-containing protein n=1 Tax=Candidula unifasciata TaxID=100452 RepID=A0A8S3YLV2_9EUPU|nr:unnamed protein product [Candidula unifasciata]
MWKQRYCRVIVLSLGTLLLLLVGCYADDDHENPHRDPSLCEVCKYLTTEVKGRLDETGKTHEVLETGYGLDQKKKRKEYRKSELRLIEVINDPHVCDKIIEYNVHAERKGSLRFAKGRSQTMETLHGLVHKGVKVELGIPYEMWDTPSAGVTEMQRQCFTIVEKYEEDIEDWYWNHQDKDFTMFLCRDRVLRKNDQECLSETWTGEKEEKQDEQEGEKGDVADQKKSKKSKKKSSKFFYKKKLKGDVGSTENVDLEPTVKDDVTTEKKDDVTTEKKDEL